MRPLVGWTLFSALIGYLVFGIIAGAFDHHGVTGHADDAALAGAATFAVLTFLGVVMQRLEERLAAPDLPRARVIARR